jgi:hypothetical protein
MEKRVYEQEGKRDTKRWETCRKSGERGMRMGKISGGASDES